MVRQIISLNESTDEQSLVHVRKDWFFLYDHKNLTQVKKISLQRAWVEKYGEWNYVAVKAAKIRERICC